MELTEAAARAQLIEHYARLFGTFQAAAGDADRLARRERQSTHMLRAITGAAQRDADGWAHEAAQHRETCVEVLHEADAIGVSELEIHRMVLALAIDHALMAQLIAEELNSGK
jgi:hypothetical protein